MSGHEFFLAALGFGAGMCFMCVMVDRFIDRRTDGLTWLVALGAVGGALLVTLVGVTS